MAVELDGLSPPPRGVTSRRRSGISSFNCGVRPASGVADPCAQARWMGPLTLWCAGARGAAKWSSNGRAWVVVGRGGPGGAWWPVSARAVEPPGNPSAALPAPFGALHAGVSVEGPCHAPRHQLLWRASGATRPPAPGPVSGLALRGGRAGGLRTWVWWSRERTSFRRKEGGGKEWSRGRTRSLMGALCKADLGSLMPGRAQVSDRVGGHGLMYWGVFWWCSVMSVCKFGVMGRGAGQGGYYSSFREYFLSSGGYDWSGEAVQIETGRMSSA